MAEWAFSAHDVIQRHLTSSERWCMTCKKHIIDTAQHLIDKLEEAAYEITELKENEDGTSIR